MYDELVKRLREPCQYENCILCQQAADAIENLICEVADEHNARLDAEERQRWIPVTERLPEPKFAREWYLVSLASGCVKTLAYEKQERSDNLWRKGWHETASPVTNWMPLPEPPQEET